MMTQFKSPKRFAYFLILGLQTLTLIACRGTVSESIVSETQPPRLGPSVATDSMQAAKPQIIERLIVRPKSLPLQNIRGLNLEIRSESEVWCERRCSQFSLSDEPGEADSIRLSAVKRTLVGLTTPGILDVQRDLEDFGTARKKLEILNVGLKGEHIALSVEDFNEGHPNFFALPMVLSQIVVKGVQFKKARFDQRDVELLLAPGCTWPNLGRTSSLSQAFVMGSYFEERTNSLGEKGVFIARKIIYPWPH
jgi:hypothetical protein